MTVRRLKRRSFLTLIFVVKSENVLILDSPKETHLGNETLYY